MPIIPSESPLCSGLSLNKSTLTSLESGNKLQTNTTTAKTIKPIASKFLSGNTAALSKTFAGAKTFGTTVESSKRFGDKKSPTRRYLGAVASPKNAKENYCKEPSITTKDDKKTSKYDAGSYTSRYANCIQAKMNESQQTRLKEINICGKPPKPVSPSGDIARQEDSGSISRNRQVVRLTIKRDKRNPSPSPTAAKTMAQKLLEKYTIKDKVKEDISDMTTKSNQETSTAIDKNYLTHQDESTHPLTINDSSKLSSSSEKVENQLKLDEGHDGDDEMSDDEGEQEATKRFVRATRAASAKKELGNSEEVKDAIYAAILHPGIDIESDEEIKRLMNGDSDESKRSSKRKSKKLKEILVKRKKSDVEIEGDIIIDKLKRYVKQQSSIKKASLNNSKELTTNPGTLDQSNKKERIVPIVLQNDDDIILNETRLSDRIGNSVSKSIPISFSASQGSDINSSPTKVPKVETTNQSRKNSNKFTTSPLGHSTNENRNKNWENKSPTDENGECIEANKCISKNDINSEIKSQTLVQYHQFTGGASSHPGQRNSDDKSLLKHEKSEIKCNKGSIRETKQISSIKTSPKDSEKKSQESLFNKKSLIPKEKGIKETNLKSQFNYKSTETNEESINSCDAKLNLNKNEISIGESKNFVSSAFDGDKKPEIKFNYDLKKSATTHISSASKDDSGFKINLFNDTESISFNDSTDMKPSLRQFLDDAKVDKNENHDTKAKKTKDEEITKINSLNKKDLKRPRQTNVVTKEEKQMPEDVTSARKILKRPVKIIKKEESEIKVPLASSEPLKPKKVWKKPAPPPTITTQPNELKSAFCGLKNPKLKVVNNITPSVDKSKNVKNTTNDSSEILQEPVIAKDEINQPKISSVKKIDQDSKPIKVSLNSLNVENKLSEKIKKINSDILESGFRTDGVSKSETSNSALSTSLSADSAYGSSPSTPQPRTNNILKQNHLETTNKIVENGNIDLNADVEKCELCGTNCHKKCEKQMPNLCGVNQKLLAEALSSVKKGSTGSSPDSRDVFRTLNAATTSKSPSSISSSEAETTTTDDDETDTDSCEYNGPSEIRSPIQTRPKFKKYDLEDFNFIKVLGKGSFGKVMLAQQVNTENYFAVKCLKKDVVLEDNDVECCLIERKVLTLGTKHPYLCHLFCSFQTPSHLFFVMEYLTGGDLMFHIQHVGRFDEYRACFYGAEIVSGLKFLHSKGIIYRDLKLDNILLDYEGHIRIADFGMCKLQIYLDRFADTFCGTPDYMAPEVIKGQHYNQCVDWWSFGVLLYEMMIGKSPFKGCDEDHLFWLICNEEPFYPRFLSREAQSILKQLLDKDGAKRLGPPYSFYGEIKCHLFFKYIDWTKIETKKVETPYKPRLRHILDVQYFDRLFTKRNAALTPLDTSILETMDQTPFKEFSYTNPNITD